MASSLRCTKITAGRNYVIIIYMMLARHFFCSFFGKRREFDGAKSGCSMSLNPQPSIAAIATACLCIDIDLVEQHTFNKCSTIFTLIFSCSCPSIWACNELSTSRIPSESQNIEAITLEQIVLLRRRRRQLSLLH